MPGLESLVGELRTALAARPDFYSVSVPDGCAPDAVPPGTPAGYARLLTLTDGPACGTSLTFWSAADLPGNQYYTRPIEGSDLPLDPDAYFCCGLFEPDPLFIRRSDESVWYFPDREVEWQNSGSFAKAADSIEEFFLEKVAGPDYAVFVGLDESMKDPDGLYDEWYILLTSIGR
ncbi:hypothetical protein ABH931_007737 [Streptacidiphilus sp. MAP12-33]|uniref:hypothetical protein n=1 Tax=Streptacidiphilus sp. MAP12-33 TaxID=3156266 RepID=UPI003512B1CB